MSEYILELQGITKIFPGVKALNKVHFQLKAGQIHALMGENGAGKSTFIKVITGVHQPEAGEIFLRGKKVDFKNPKEAIAHGIAAIYQHVTCFPDLSVSENIYSGHESMHGKMPFIDWNTMHRNAEILLKRLGSDLDPRQQMGALSVAQQQIIEIAKALSTDADIIIMDEPTAALTNRECEELYRITEQLRDEGKAIIFISHRFEDMYRLASHVTVFRDAQYIGSWLVNEITNSDLINAMVGRSLTEMYPPALSEPKDQIVFKADGLSRTGYFKDISFDVRQGEIVALTGLVGAGRSEVCQAIFGIDKYDTGTVELMGQPVAIDSPLTAMKLGIGYLPEDRQRQGLVLSWSIEKNITLANLALFNKGILIQEKKETETANRLAKLVSVKCQGVSDLVSSLSGGNQQKVIVAKLLTSDLKLIIMDEPTKGVDVGAKHQIYQIMRELARDGYAILMVSSEMPEVIGMSDRVIVMHEGRITLIGNTHDAGTTQEKLLEAAVTRRSTADSTIGGVA
ncbi:MAG: sugar ABC transporter ATP-binding protein [Eubacteriales bacterium]|nr:sugar ABC transporter ATP-binding protein [Eubacteriales bacterium]